MPTPTLRPLAGLCALAALALAHVAPATAAPMTLEDRIACQTAIDEVRWSNMIWPESNPTPKPPLSEVLPPEAVRAKVIDQLRMEAALDGLYGVRIGDNELQAELDRMARQTRAPEQLQALYAALGNDAARIADCLARPQLARAKLQSRYSFDTRLHAGTRAKAREHASDVKSGNRAPVEREITYVLDDGRRSAKSMVPDAANLNFPLNPEAWERKLDELRNIPDSAAGNLQARETRSEFYSERLQSVAAGRFTVKQLVWPKLDFGAWWKAQAGNWNEDVREIGTKTLSLAPIAAIRAGKAAKSGPDDSWWTEDFIPASRSGHVSVWTGTEMIVWGGWSAGDQPISGGGRYSPATDSWQPMSTAGAVGLQGIGLQAVWANDQMIVWRSATQSGARYRPDTDTWIALPTDGAPASIGGNSVVWTGKFFIVWGGGASGGEYLSSGARFDPELNSWSSTTLANAPSPRVDHVAVAAGGNMLVWGGRNAEDFFNDGRLYNPNMNTWSSISNAGAPAARAEAQAVWTGSQMIVWGGRNNFLNFADGGRFVPSSGSSGTWQLLPGNAAPSPRYGYSLVWAGDRAILWGGVDDFGQFADAGASYSPASNAWSALPEQGAPQARYGHTALWDGSQMIVWGGNPCYNDLSCAQVTSSGARYHPAQDTWSPMRDAQYSPLERVEHASVWTGEQLQIWGGVPATSAQTDGGIFTPATATWGNPYCDAVRDRKLHTAVWSGSESLIWGGVGTTGAQMPTNGARYSPLMDSCSTLASEGVTQRYSHTAVWLGGEMIVWGGRNTASDYPVGGMRYKPGVGWVLMSTVDSPSPRYGHVAVAAGEQMLVWGGLNGATFLGNGGRYRLSDNTWVSDLPTALAPEPRAFHTAVWTGQQMVVWGGIGPGMNALDEGGSYSLGDNAWSWVTNDSAPTPRLMHTAVWTGRDMIVWGGDDGAAADTGGRYRVEDRIWLPMSMDGAPAPRSGHTAVWTGAEMFVWGGRGVDDFPLAGLGSYSADGTPAPLFSDGFE